MTCSVPVCGLEGLRARMLMGRVALLGGGQVLRRLGRRRGGGAGAGRRRRRVRERRRSAEKDQAEGSGFQDLHIQLLQKPRGVVGARPDLNPCRSPQGGTEITSWSWMFGPPPSDRLCRC